MKPTCRGTVVRRAMALAGLITTLEACMHWTTRPLTPQQPADSGMMRVTLVGGQQIYLTNPFLSGDSLVWNAHVLRSTGGDSLVRQGVPFSQVAKIEVRRLDPAATTLAILAGVGIVAIIANGGGNSSGGGGGSPCRSGDPNCLSSCPLVYSWDGKHWRLDSGTFGGAITRGLARTDVDNLDFVAARDGIVRLKVTNELSETDYVDALSVVAVDHDPNVTVAPDGSGRLYALGPLTHPVTARDFHGGDALTRVRATDGVSWQSSFVPRDTARLEDVRDGLDLAFLRPPGASSARLVLDGHTTPWAATMLSEFVAAHGNATRAWYDSLDAVPALAHGTAAALARNGFLSVAVRQRDGWRSQGLFWEAGPEIVKRQVQPLDLSGVSGDTVHIRLESAPSFWLIDQVAIDFSPPPPPPLATTELPVARATDGHGRDVRRVIGAIDGQVLTLEQGDSAIVEFPAPPVPAGRARTYLLRSSGWYRIRSAQVAPPAVALLQQLQAEPYAGSRIAVARLDELLGDLRQRARTAAGQ
jgi:hypothetical protein